jgi:hypothetical protein
MPEVSPPSVYKVPQRAWAALIKEIEKHKPALANTLADCELTAGDGGRYILKVAGNRFAVNSVNKNLGQLERRLSALMGTAVGLQVNAAQTSSQAEIRQKKKEADALKNEALGHPLVGEVVERFQGEVIEVKLL